MRDIKERRMSKFWTLRTFAAAAVLIAAVMRVVTQDIIASAIDATLRG